MELALVGLGKESISMESLEYFLNMGFVLRHIVRVDEDVVQINDDCDINHVFKDVVHKSLKSCGYIDKPSGITDHLKQPYQVLQSSIHLQLQLRQDGIHVRGQSWYKLVPIMVCLRGQR